jgi:flagellum-specific ATP synthase
VRGSNPEIDKALSLIGRIKEFLQQDIEEKADFESSIKMLFEVVGS